MRHSGSASSDSSDGKRRFVPETRLPEESMNQLADALLKRIQNREARTGVVGLGYVGLPLAVELAKAGFHATGIDLDERKIQAINAGKSYIPDVQSSDVSDLRKAGRLDATTDFSIVKELDTVNICVPTPLRKTKDPDMSYIVSAVESIAAHLRPGLLICLESTTYPGTTDEVVQPLLEATGLKAGKDFFVAFSPERVDPGNPTFQTHNVPKVVGGLTSDCSRLAAALYGAAITTIVPVSSTRVAEMVKLLENTFRAVNIGLVNELALMCDRMNIDVWEVVEAAKTKPFGFMAFYPGPGLGGHCIPIDPFYLSWKAKQSGFDPRFIELAGHINGAMPHYVVEKVADALNTKRKAINGSNILIAGVAYKREIDDMRESPALDVMGLLEGKGASISYADPYVPEVHAREWSGKRDVQSVAVSRGMYADYDCVVIITDHKAFDYEVMLAEADLIVDTRNAIRRSAPHVFKLGSPRPEAHGQGVALA
jgi:UDP-N-acetyl-D-glucosamine dehydrogenase